MSQVSATCQTRQSERYRQKTTHSPPDSNVAQHARGNNIRDFRAVLLKKSNGIDHKRFQLGVIHGPQDLLRNHLLQKDLAILARLAIQKILLLVDPDHDKKSLSDHGMILEDLLFGMDGAIRVPTPLLP